MADREGRDDEAVKFPTMIFVKPPKKKREEILIEKLYWGLNLDTYGRAVGFRVV